MLVFDGSLKTKHKDRAAMLQSERGSDQLLDAISERLTDRMEDCLRKFPTALVIGGAMPSVARCLTEPRFAAQVGLEKVIYVDSSINSLQAARKQHDTDGRATLETEYVQVKTEEAFLPELPMENAKDSVDVVIACLGLHWYNDLPGVLMQCNHVLKPDGLFLGALFGGETLQELRIACAIAEQEREGGLSARMSPLAKVKDGGNLLSRAGIALPAVDVDDIVIRYPTALELVEHLRVMGETNAVLQRRQELPRDTALAAAAIYQTKFAEEDGSVPATFQVIYVSGWGPSDKQQKPDARGSADASLGDLHKELGGEAGGFPDDENTKS
jgi:NADH dehydrogenase [ubiquinone] 1 alpha subcomplex assembly factor 5